MYYFCLRNAQNYQAKLRSKVDFVVVVIAEQQRKIRCPLQFSSSVLAKTLIALKTKAYTREEGSENKNEANILKCYKDKIEVNTRARRIEEVERERERKIDQKNMKDENS